MKYTNSRVRISSSSLMYMRRVWSCLVSLISDVHLYVHGIPTQLVGMLKLMDVQIWLPVSSSRGDNPSMVYTYQVCAGPPLSAQFSFSKMVASSPLHPSIKRLKSLLEMPSAMWRPERHTCWILQVLLDRWSKTKIKLCIYLRRTSIKRGSLVPLWSCSVLFKIRAITDKLPAVITVWTVLGEMPGLAAGGRMSCANVTWYQRQLCQLG